MINQFIATPCEKHHVERYGNAPLGEPVNRCTLNNVLSPKDAKKLASFKPGEERIMTVHFTSGDKGVPFRVASLPSDVERAVRQQRECVANFNQNGGDE